MTDRPDKAILLGGRYNGTELPRPAGRTIHVPVQARDHDPTAELHRTYDYERTPETGRTIYRYKTQR